MQDPYEVLGLTFPSSKEEIKARYYELAKKHHPDKLQHLQPEERTKHEEHFKKVNLAYELLTKTDFEHSNKTDWKGIWSSVESFMQTSQMTAFADLLSNVIHIAKEYKKHKTTEHHITLEVTLEEVHNRKEKKCRLFLKNVPEPVFIKVNCGCYPNYLYTHDSHYIYITFQILPHPIYSLDSLFDTFDLYAEIPLTLLEYFTGTTKEVEYLDQTYIPVHIPPFCTDPINLPDKGLFNKDLLTIVPKIKLPASQDIPEKNKLKIIKYLTTSRAKST
jgi:DnaJ-class molecular chaperone